MPGFNFRAITEEAEKRYYKYRHSGVRGQTVTEQDSPEYWYALVAHEYAITPVSKLITLREFDHE